MRGVVLGDRIQQSVDSHADMCAAWGEAGAYRFIGASVLGKMHVQRGKPRDDAFAFRLAGPWLAVAVSDGVGSCPRSRYGSSCAVEMLCEHLIRVGVRSSAAPAEKPLPPSAPLPVSAAAEVAWETAVQGDAGSEATAALLIPENRGFSAESAADEVSGSGGGSPRFAQASPRVVRQGREVLPALHEPSTEEQEQQAPEPFSQAGEDEESDENNRLAASQDYRPIWKRPRSGVIHGMGSWKSPFIPRRAEGTAAPLPSSEGHQRPEGEETNAAPSLRPDAAAAAEEAAEAPGGVHIRIIDDGDPRREPVPPPHARNQEVIGSSIDAAAASPPPLLEEAALEPVSPFWSGPDSENELLAFHEEDTGATAVAAVPAAVTPPDEPSADDSELLMIVPDDLPDSEPQEPAAPLAQEATAALEEAPLPWVRLPQLLSPLPRAQMRDFGTMAWYLPPPHTADKKDGDADRERAGKPLAEEDIQEAFRRTHQGLEHFARTQGVSLDDLACTLLALLVNTETGQIAVGHIGDGLAAGRAGSSSTYPLVDPIRPDTFGEVYPFTRSDWEDFFTVRVLSDEETAGLTTLFLMTDGVSEDCADSGETLHLWSRDIDAQVRQSPEGAEAATRLTEWLATYEHPGSYDDRTLIVVQRCSA